MDLLGTDHIKNMEILEGTGPGGLFRGAAQGPGCETQPEYIDVQAPDCLNNDEPIFNGLSKRPFSGCETRVPLEKPPVGDGFLMTYGKCDPCLPKNSVPAGLVIVDGVDQFDPNNPQLDQIKTRDQAAEAGEPLKPVTAELSKTEYRSFLPYASGWAGKVCREVDLCDPLAVRRMIRDADVLAARRDEGMLLQAIMAEALWRGKSFVNEDCCINSQYTLETSFDAILSSLETQGRLSIDNFDTVIAPQGLGRFFSVREGQPAFGGERPNLGSIFSGIGINRQILTQDWAPGTNPAFPQIPGVGEPLEAPIPIDCETGNPITADLFLINSSNAAIGVGRTKRVGFGEEFADWGLTLDNCRGLFSERERMMIFWGCCPVIHLRITLKATGGMKAGFSDALSCAPAAPAEEAA